MLYLILYMPFRMTARARQDIAGICFVSFVTECPTDDLRLLTGYEHLHSARHRNTLPTFALCFSVKPSILLIPLIPLFFCFIAQKLVTAFYIYRYLAVFPFTETTWVRYHGIFHSTTKKSDGVCNLVFKVCPE